MLQFLKQHKLDAATFLPHLHALGAVRGCPSLRQAYARWLCQQSSGTFTEPGWLIASSSIYEACEAVWWSHQAARADLFYVEESDIMALGLKPIPRKKLVAAIAAFKGEAKEEL